MCFISKKIKMGVLLSFIFLFNIIKAQTDIVRSFPQLSFSNPVDIQHAGDNSNRLFIVSQEGVIHVFENDDNVSSSTTFLDITSKVLFSGEQGLLGLAFHPNYENNGQFYVNYTTSNPRRTIISRFLVSSTDANLAETTSEQIILEVNQPYSNHNGGQIAFGPDGFLYISFGDGGSGGDPENRSQNRTTLLGKMVRIDIDNQENGKKYSIPDDNPYKNNVDNFAEEIFAYGLRNVWRFSFDSSGNIWGADVGQNKWEEIHIIENGGNYGWRIMEGNHCYNPSNNCDQSNLILPIWEYDHSSSGGYSITGGFVYEGNLVPGLLNKYVYADFVTGNIWAYDLEQSNNSFITKFSAQISTFGIDQNKNLYFADYGSGKIYKFIDENVNSVGSLTPNFHKLEQNYPNPFNPSTIISYSIGNNNGSASFVNLDVFNSLGEKVATLVNDFKGIGNYNIEFNKNSTNQNIISSGVYFYRMRVNDFLATNKMVILN